MGAAAEEGAVSGFTAVAACSAMAFGYVAILYSPTLILRLPPPRSLRSFMIRRFACAAVSSLLSALACSFLLGVWRHGDISSIFGVYGIRKDHTLESLVLPLVLSSLLYAGSLVKKVFVVTSSLRGGGEDSCCLVRAFSLGHLTFLIQSFLDVVRNYASNVLVWRNYVVAPITEELVFRACMIPLLLCGGIKTYNIIFLSPIFFSLAHLNHMLELYYQQNFSFSKAFLSVGLQLGYTVIFGWYAAFLFLRTGNLISPIVAHVFCNVMGLPVFMSSQTKGAATVAFAAGLVGFVWLLFPATNPELYNDSREHCSCWHGYCSWN